MSGGDNIYVTQKDLQNNPGVDPEQIAEVKSQYHFHRISSVSLSGSVLHCVFAVDEDPASIFYTPLEDGAAPVRRYEVEAGREEKIEIMPDGLSVRIREQYISSEEIWPSHP